MTTTVVLGASANPDRYSNKAIRLLKSYGHPVIPVHPTLKEIEGIPVVASLSEVTVPVDTLTLYVGPERGEPLAGQMLALKPRRVIMNPGTESGVITRTLQGAGIEVVEGCTLVMLKTGQY